MTNLCLMNNSGPICWYIGNFISSFILESQPWKNLVYITSLVNSLFCKLKLISLLRSLFYADFSHISKEQTKNILFFEEPLAKRLSLGENNTSIMTNLCLMNESGPIASILAFLLCSFIFDSQSCEEFCIFGLFDHLLLLQTQTQILKNELKKCFDFEISVGGLLNSQLI